MHIKHLTRSPEYISYLLSISMNKHMFVKTFRMHNVLLQNYSSAVIGFMPSYTGKEKVLLRILVVNFSWIRSRVKELFYRP